MNIDIIIVALCESKVSNLLFLIKAAEVHRPTEQILHGYLWGKFCLVIRFVPGGGHWAYAPMTPPWYKTNNPAEFADLIFETPWYK